MATFEYKGISFEVDEDGYLTNPGKWDRVFSEYYAEQAGMTLTEGHWKLIEAARRYYEKYHCVEMERLACKDAGMERGSIHKLFGGSMRKFEKIAGIEMTWATD